MKKKFIKPIGIAALVILLVLQGVWLSSLYHSAKSNYQQTMELCLMQAANEELRMRQISLGNRNSLYWIPPTDTIITKKIQTMDTVFYVTVHANDPTVAPRIQQYGYKKYLPLNVSHVDSLFKRYMGEHHIPMKASYVEYLDLKKHRVIADNAPNNKPSGYIESSALPIDILDSIGLKVYANTSFFSILQPYTLQLTLLAILTLIELYCLCWLFFNLIGQYKEKLIDFIKKVSCHIKKPSQASTIKIADLQEQLTSSNCDKAIESAGQISNELNHTQFYIDEVLAIIHEDEHPAIFAKEYLALQPFFNQLKERYEQVAGKKVQITIQADKNATLYINRIHFHNIMEALIGNAIRFSNDPVHIELRTFVVEQHVTVIIKDNGWGIPANEQERIFHKFYKIKSHDERLTDTGFGMGLTYVKTVVRAMGGEIFVESKENECTEFIMIFSNDPLEDQQSEYFDKLGKARVYESIEDLQKYFSLVFDLYNWEVVDVKIEPLEEYNDPYDPAAIRIIAKPKDPSKNAPIPFFTFEYYYDVRLVKVENGLSIFVLIKSDDPYSAEHQHFKYSKYMQQRK